MSIIPNTYNGIVSAVIALAEDDSVEFENYLPAAIFLAEERLIKELDVEGLKSLDYTTTSVGNRIVAKPSGYRFGHNFSCITSAGTKTLTKKSFDFIKDYWPFGNTSSSSYPYGQPKYYSDNDNSGFIVAPTPSSAYIVEIQYVKQVSALSSSIQTNYFTEFAPDALFYGTMSNMAEFMKDYQIQTVWEAKYERAMQNINNQGRRERRDDATVPNNTKINKNTLRGDN